MKIINPDANLWNGTCSHTKTLGPRRDHKTLLQALLKSGRLLSCQLPRSRFWLSQLLAAPLQLRMRVDWDPTLEEDPRLNWQARQLWVVL